jgi:hypothetical protein
MPGAELLRERHCLRRIDLRRDLQRRWLVRRRRMLRCRDLRAAPLAELPVKLTKRRAWWAAGGAASLGVVLIWQVHTPASVAWEPAPLAGCAAMKAEGLVLQQESSDVVWATQGYDIYRSRGGGPFERVFRVRPPFGEPWGGYLSGLRRHFGYQELTEIVPLHDDLLLAFAGGAVYRIDLALQEQELVLTLRYFGRGKGRGVMSRIAVDDQGRIFFGEYMSLYHPHTTRLWRSEDEGRTWSTAYELTGADAGHVHGVEWDPYGRALWMMTGDNAAESRLGLSTDGGTHFTWVGVNDERFRACSLIFTVDAVLWATDTWDNRLLRWNRTSGAIDDLGPLPSESLYAQQLDGSSALVSQSNWDASVLLVRVDGSVRAIARFTPDRVSGRPLPGVRLARGSSASRRWIYFNPLRTTEEEAAIYRVAIDDLASCTPPPPHLARQKSDYGGS